MRTWARVVIALAVVGPAAACKREPTFDERYAGAQKVIRDKTAELDKDMATRAAEADAITPPATPEAQASAGVSAVRE